MKTLKSLIAGLLTIMLLLTFAGCDIQEKMLDKSNELLEKQQQNQVDNIDLDYDAIIDSFVSDSHNTVTLEIGEEHKPTEAMMLQSGGVTYSSDEKVVTVTSLGKVTAVGEGTAYVILASSNTMYVTYCYKVNAPAAEADLSDLPVIDGIDFAYEIENFVDKYPYTHEIAVGDKDKPIGAGSSDNTYYTSDEAVAAVATNGTVTGVGKGTAYILIKFGDGDMFYIHKYTVR